MTDFHHTLALEGCTPTPLAGYLKALGVLRLLTSPSNHVNDQAADPKVRGWWQGERFHLQTCLDRDALINFFLVDYAPSPIIAPWNGGSGFYLKDNKKDNEKGFNQLLKAEAPRFQRYREIIEHASWITKSRGLSVQPKDKEEKANLIAELRGKLPDYALPWMDAVLVLSEKQAFFPPLLGTGGNDGNLEFTDNFIQCLASASQKKSDLGLFDAKTGKALPSADTFLKSALFDETARSVSGRAAIGQFSPEAAGGPNATTGYKRSVANNPFDFVLMLEGALMFAGAATRRHQGGRARMASFPFTVDVTGAGWGSLDTTDEASSRAEFWAPLWSRPVSCAELGALLSEGRGVINARPIRNGLDAARAAASLGFDRGLDAFQRYGFVKRAGKSYRAVPQGRQRVAREVTTGSKLIAELDQRGWLRQVHKYAKEKETPQSVREVVRRLEDALFALTSSDSDSTRTADARTRAVPETLEALGAVVARIALSHGAQEKFPPPPRLSAQWVEEVERHEIGDSAEFRVAAALASLGWSGRTAEKKHEKADSAQSTGNAPSETTLATVEEEDTEEIESGGIRPQSALPMAAHFAPLDKASVFGEHRRWVKKEKVTRTCVWGSGGLVSNLVRVLERRIIETNRQELEEPFEAATPVGLADVAAFLSPNFDDARCARLLAGLVWVRPKRLGRLARIDSQKSSAPPFAYAAIKPLFSPIQEVCKTAELPKDTRLPIPPGLVTRLRAEGGGAIDTAVQMALARARGSGLASPFISYARDGAFGAGLDGHRLAAALLIPIRRSDLKRLLCLAYPNTQETNHDA